MKLFVVCPKTTIPNWTYWSKNYGIHLITAISYESLRGAGDKKLNHPFLVKDGKTYRATELFSKLLKIGILLVFDEYQKVKNDNTQLASSHALVKELVRWARIGHPSRVALLSGTPCDVKEKVTSTFKMLGVILSDKLYHYNRSSKTYELLGIEEAIIKCNQYDKAKTFAITCKPINKTTAKTICHELYYMIYKNHVASSMPPLDVDLAVFNYYIRMKPNELKRMKHGLMMFKSATDYREDLGEVNYGQSNWGDITRSRMEIDSAKIPGVCRLTIKDLKSNPQAKVLIYCRYKRDMFYAYERLKKYNPLILNGDTKDKERTEIISKFQQDNNKYRVIISNSSIGGVGIELDDQHGNRPRFMNILPSYFFTDEIQTIYRIARSETKSKATVRIIYSRDCPHETGILDSMVKKSEVMRSMIANERDQNIKYPVQYPDVFSSETDSDSDDVSEDISDEDEEEKTKEQIDNH